MPYRPLRVNEKYKTLTTKNNTKITCNNDYYSNNINNNIMILREYEILDNKNKENFDSVCNGTIFTKFDIKKVKILSHFSWLRGRFHYITILYIKSRYYFLYSCKNIASLVTFSFSIRINPRPNTKLSFNKICGLGLRI